MPTGYTAKIRDGISFEEFALDCARNFGACITLRDEPGGGEAIPDEFYPNNYHAKRVVEIEEELLKLNKMSNYELKDRAEHDHWAKEQRRLAEIKDVEKMRKKYESMLEKVLAWKPPTKDHEGLKEFMINQIKESINFDCVLPDNIETDYPVLDADTWYAKKRASLLHSIKYHQDAYAEEVTRVRERNKWVADLRRSLK